MKKKAISLFLAMVFLLTAIPLAVAGETGKVENRITKRIDNINKKQELQAELEKAKNLRQEAKSLRLQIIEKRKRIKELLKNASKAEDVSKLEYALGKAAEVRAKIDATKANNEKLRNVFQNLKGTRTNQDFNGALTAISSIQTALQERIEIFQEGNALLDEIIAELS